MYYCMQVPTQLSRNNSFVWFKYGPEALCAHFIRVLHVEGDRGQYLQDLVESKSVVDATDGPDHIVFYSYRT